MGTVHTACTACCCGVHMVKIVYCLYWLLLPAPGVQLENNVCCQYFGFLWCAQDEDCVLPVLWCTQDDDLYSASGYVLAAAMELHARITNAYAADKDRSLLPHTFKYYDQAMPKPPPHCAWQFDIKKQLWVAIHTSNGRLCRVLDNGIKYVLGVGRQALGSTNASLCELLPVAPVTERKRGGGLQQLFLHSTTYTTVSCAALFGEFAMRAYPWWCL